MSDVIEQSQLGDVELLAALDSLIQAGRLVEAHPTSRTVPKASVPRAESIERRTTRPLPVAFVWQPERERRRGGLRWVASTLVMALVAAVSGWLGASFSRNGAGFAPPAAATPAPATVVQSARVLETYSAAVRPYPPEATVEVDGREVGTGYWTSRLPRDGAMHEVRVTAAGFLPARILFVDTAPPLDVRLEPLPALLTPPPLAAEVPPVLSHDSEKLAAVERRAWAEPRKNKAPVRARESTDVPTRSAKTASSPKKRPYVQIIDPGAPSARRD